MAGRGKFLTFWSEVLQTLYFGISLLNDLFGSNLKPHDNLKKRSVLQRIRDNFVACIVWPVGTFVVITFWGIYAVDRELVFPKALDAIIPTWLNHIMHSTVLLFLLTDKLLVYHHYPSDLLGLSATLAFGFIYAVWILWVAYAADIWVYPILEVMTWYQRSAFLGGLWLSLSFVYLAGRVVTTLIWGLPRKAIVKKRD
ncbi:Androgen-dependent TFPI-regulating protein [Lamellibrachia satsuma]|nr:Androgen-dependent TFPI-regulating protein [Lamellibrachia satsuma]